jgi:hypothetical protein
VDIRIEISEHEHSNTMHLIEVQILSPLGVWKVIENWGTLKANTKAKIEELKEFYRQPNTLCVDSNISYIDSEVLDSEMKPNDNDDVSPGLSRAEAAQLFEEVATPPPALSAVPGSGTSKPSPSSATLEVVGKSSMQCVPWDEHDDMESPTLLCKTHNWRASAREWDDGSCPKAREKSGSLHLDMEASPRKRCQLRRTGGDPDCLTHPGEGCFPPDYDDE